MAEQKINCTVQACEHLDCNGKCCSLNTITVRNDRSCPTAHYCAEYKEKHSL